MSISVRMEGIMASQTFADFLGQVADIVKENLRTG
jgi:hypothetical protein